MRVGWSDTMAPPGHKLVGSLLLCALMTHANTLQSFKAAIETMSLELFLKLLVPRFMMGLTEHTKKIQLAFEELQVIQVASLLHLFTYRSHSNMSKK